MALPPIKFILNLLKLLIVLILRLVPKVLRILNIIHIGSIPILKLHGIGLASIQTVVELALLTKVLLITIAAAHLFILKQKFV